LDRNDLYKYEILSQFEKAPGTSNRIMTAKLGCSIKLAHGLIADLIHRGYVSVLKHNSRRWDYLLTPAGIAEKARLTAEFLDFTFRFYHEARKRSSQVCSDISRTGRRDVALLGSGQLAEIAYLGIKEWGLELLEVYDLAGGGKFLGFETRDACQLGGSRADFIVVCLFDVARPMSEGYLPSGVPRRENMRWVF